LKTRILSRLSILPLIMVGLVLCVLLTMSGGQVPVVQAQEPTPTPGYCQLPNGEVIHTGGLYSQVITDFLTTDITQLTPSFDPSSMVDPANNGSCSIGDIFDHYGQIYDVDPRLLVAISGPETSFANHLCREHFPGYEGWQVNNHNPLNVFPKSDGTDQERCFDEGIPPEKGATFDYWAEGIKAAALNIKNNFLDNNSPRGIETLSKQPGYTLCGGTLCYCVDDCTYQNVDDYYAAMGGNPFTMNLKYDEAYPPLNERVEDDGEGKYHICTLYDSNRVECLPKYGYKGNNYGQLGTGVNPDPALNHVLGLAGDVKSLDVGDNHTCVVAKVYHFTINDEYTPVWCWGYNHYGQLGDNSTADSSKIVEVKFSFNPSSPVRKIKMVAAGANHTCALYEPDAYPNGGKVICWGDNQYDQLHDAITGNGRRYMPVDYNGDLAFVKDASGVNDLTGATRIWANENFTCAELSAGGYYCWGALLTLEKSANTPSIAMVNQEFEYKYQVRNISKVTVTGITVRDDHITGDVCQIASLNANETVECQAHYIVTQDDMDPTRYLSNTATVTADNSASVNDTWSIPIIPSTITPTPKPPSYHNGFFLTGPYAFTIDNRDVEGDLQYKGYHLVSFIQPQGDFIGVFLDFKENDDFPDDVWFFANPSDAVPGISYSELWLHSLHFGGSSLENPPPEKKDYYFCFVRLGFEGPGNACHSASVMTGIANYFSYSALTPPAGLKFTVHGWPGLPVFSTFGIANHYPPTGHTSHDFTVYYIWQGPQPGQYPFTLGLAVKKLGEVASHASGVTVCAHNAGIETCSEPSNELGQAYLQLDPGTYQFSFRKNGFEFMRQGERGITIPGETFASIDIPEFPDVTPTPSPTSTPTPSPTPAGPVEYPVAVTVADTNGNPEAGLAVAAYTGSDYMNSIGTTNAQGQVTLSVPAGTFWFKADKNYTAFWSGEENHCAVPVCTSAGITTTIPVTVTVLNRSEQPEPNLAVNAMNGDEYAGYSAATNAQGQAVLTLPEGNYRFRVFKDNLYFYSSVTENHCAVPGCTAADVTVDYSVVVSVVDADDNPEAGLDVAAYDLNTLMNSAGTTNAQGQVTLAVPNGTFRFKTIKDGVNFWSGAENHCTVPGCSSATIIVSMTAPGGFSKASLADNLFGRASGLTLQWNNSSNAAGYEYCFDTTDNGICDGAWVDAGSATSATISGLSLSTTYYWQVRAHNTSGTTYADGAPGSGTWWTFRTSLFADVPQPGLEWMRPSIEGFYLAGITSGCGSNPLRYCPGDLVTRGAASIFILRAKHGSGYAPPAPAGIFSDLTAASMDWIRPWAEQFYNEGITGGCGTNPLRFCPDASLTRDAMAVLLLRAKYGSGYQPPAASNPKIFADVPVPGKEWMQPWIEEFYRQGYTAGCGGTPIQYCPEEPVSRATAAVFVSRVFNIPPAP
jgi:hypothetical protein